MARHSGGSQQQGNDRDSQDSSVGNALTPSCLHFRIGFQNIKGLPVDPTKDHYELIPNFISKYQFGIFNLQEINLNLRRFPASGQWRRRFFRFKGTSVVATNCHSNSRSRVLFGGTASLISEQATVRMIDRGMDPRQLGRWTWVLLEGAQGRRTRVVNGYRPCPDNSNRGTTVLSQQELYFRKQGQANPDPRAIFLSELGESIVKWVQDGEQIVLGLDANEDVFTGPVHDWATSLGLTNVFRREIGRSANVRTCNRQTVSNYPIDCIWVTPGLDVAACGYSGFGEFDLGGPIDHRLLWLDLTMESLFGFPAPKPAIRAPDTLPVRDPAARRQYNNYVRRQRHRRGITQSLRRLQQAAVDGRFTVDDQEEYNRIAFEDDRIRKKARKVCRKFYAGRVLFSEEVGKKRSFVHLWWLVVTRMKKRRTDTRKIRRLMRELQVVDALRLPLPAAEKRLRAAKKAYYASKKNHVALREAFEQQLDERRAAKFGTSVDAQTKQRKNTASSRRTHWNINQVMKPTRRVGINTLETTGHDGTTVHCNTKDQIDEACKQEGIRRFSQTEDTPFMMGPLHQLLGFEACQRTVDTILSGTFEPPEGLDAATLAFIHELRMPDKIKDCAPITGLVSPADHIAGWKKMKAKIASSPFAPKLADYIVGCDKLEVAAIDAAFRNIPVLAGFSPEAWQKAVDVMIPKKATSRHVTQLRIIVLFHSLFNMLNKQVGREMIRQADSLGLIPDEAYGSRPGRRANICALNKVLTLDVMRQLRRAGIICSNDATSCYDRIVHVVASICMQRLGVSPETCKVMFGTLREVQHYISTAYGQSDTPYGAVQIPLQGVGQGNGAGPAIWLVMSIPLINALRTAGYGIRLTSAISSEELYFVCFTFVDDTDTIHSPRVSMPTATLIAEMQAALDLWAGTLRATGGALKPEKCHWWLIDFVWSVRHQQWRYKTIDEAPGSLALRTDNQVATLERLPVDIAKESLGIWIAMDGNSSAQVEALTHKVDAWADKIRTGQLSAHEGWVSLTSGISKSLAYPLTATSLSRVECSSITKKLKTVALAALRYPKSFPTAVVFAPKRFLGLNFPDFWFDQCFTHIGDLISFGGKQRDITGSLFRQRIENLRVELGLPGCPLNYEFKRLAGCTTRTHLHVTWEFCSQTGLVFKDHLSDLKPQREHDVFLMSAFLDAGYTPSQLSILNRCRLHRRVIFLSDLVNGDGTCILQDELDSRDPRTLHSESMWPRSACPNAHAWRMWRDALSKCFLVQPLPATLRLRRPLGRWYVLPAGWPSFLSHDSRTLYEREGMQDLFRVYRIVAHGHSVRRARYTWSTSLQTLPPDASPTATFGTRSLRFTTGGGGFALPPLPPVGVDTDWWGMVVKTPASFQPFLDGIRAGTAVALPDGSFKEDFGTAAFTLRPHIVVRDYDFVLVNQTPGYAGQIDPYRAELAGALGVVLTVNRLLVGHDIKGSITLACDCKSVLSNGFRHRHMLPPNTPHYDLLSALHHALSVSPVKWHTRHVKGHQDKNVPYHELDQWAQLNVDMDELAKHFWQTLHARGFVPFSLPPLPGQWTVYRTGIRVTSWTRDVAEELFYGNTAEDYWRRKLALPGTTPIAWAALAHAYRNLPMHQQLWVPRWFTNFLPLGVNLLRWKLHHDDLCPRCDVPETHRHHVVRCGHPAAQALWQSKLGELGAWMESQHTCPDVQRGLLSLLQSQYDGTPWTPPGTRLQPVLNAIAAQQAAGLVSVLDGFFHPSWAEAQQSYYEWLGRRNTGFRWHSLLIRRIWEIAWDLWQHRVRVASSEDSLQMARRHDDLNAQITAMFSSPRAADPNYARWFAKPLWSVLLDTIDSKERWLEMTSSYPSD